MREPAAGGSAREPLLDALRVLALAAVFVVNIGGYSVLPEGPAAPPRPEASALAQVAVFIVAALFQGKGYPLLAFLFGYSFALSLRARRVANPVAHRLRRMCRLLSIGVLHGTLFYAGDVLTIYAVCGFFLLALSAWRLEKLVVVLVFLGVLAVGSTLVFVVAGLLAIDGATAVAGPSLAAPASMRAWLLVNANLYASSTIGALVFGLPAYLSLMLAGFIGGRLRWLSHPRWRPTLRKYRAWALPLGAIANLLFAWATLRWLPQAPQVVAVLSLLTWLIGPLLLAGLVPWCVLRWQARPTPILRWLAPAGASTLTLYLSSSLVGLLFLSGVGMALAPGSMALLGNSLAAWAGLVWLLRNLALRGVRLPLERWLARP